MQDTQLSLFSNDERLNATKKEKTPKLGRYERIKRELEKNNIDPYKIFIDVDNPLIPASQYTFVDLFCGAGGITQGLVQAGFQNILKLKFLLLSCSVIILS